jgi:hypothetical protein
MVFHRESCLIAESSNPTLNAIEFRVKVTRIMNSGVYYARFGFGECSTKSFLLIHGCLALSPRNVITTIVSHKIDQFVAK